MSIQTFRFNFSIVSVLLAVCLSALAYTVQANNFVVNKAGDEVWDRTTGWVWMRCSLGQSWNGQTCVGTGQEFTFDDAAAAARSRTGWVVPSVAQLVSLRICSAGEKNEFVTVQGQGGGTFKETCADGSHKPTINRSVFPETPNKWFWTSSPYVGYSFNAWVVNFLNGSVGGYYRSYDLQVRLVRESQFLGGEPALTFVLDRKLPQQADFAQKVWAQGGMLEQNLGTVSLPWESKMAGNQPALPFNVPSSVPTVDVQQLATRLKAFALEDTY